MLFFLHVFIFTAPTITSGASQVALVVKEPTCQCKTQVRSLGQEDLVEKKMATHSGILTWRIPWTEEPGGLQSIRLQSQT